VRVVPVGEGRIAVLGAGVAAIGTADVCSDNGHQLCALGTADDLIGEPRVAQVDMTGVDHRRHRSLSPQVGDGECQHTQHAARALERLYRGELLG